MLTYLLEIRRRLIYIFSFFGLLFGLFYFYSANLFKSVILPLLKILPQNAHIIATQITTPLFTPISMAADAAILCSAPFALFHIWCFLAPGLYRHERFYLLWIMLYSTILFCLGGLFCYYLILPFIFQSVVSSLPKGVHFMPDMGFAIDFTTHMILIFGICFQVPLVVFFLVRLGILTRDCLIKIRPYVIVAAFTIGMLLTPPDVISQILLAVPLWLLYESGIFFTRFGKQKHVH